MYSGGDSSGSQNPPSQWPLNAGAFQNAQAEQIDWAALAQQWIIMKESGPPVPDPIPMIPPAARLEVHKRSLNEGGEAPMDMDNDRDEAPAPPAWSECTPPSQNDSSWGWGQQQTPPQQQQHWPWNNSWQHHPPALPPQGVSKTALLPTPSYNQYSGSNDSSSNFGK